MAIQRATGDARDLFVIDDRLAVLNDGDPSPDQRDIEALPFSRPAGQFRREEGLFSDFPALEYTPANISNKANTSTHTIF